MNAYRFRKIKTHTKPFLPVFEELETDAVINCNDHVLPN